MKQRTSQRLPLVFVTLGSVLLVSLVGWYMWHARAAPTSSENGDKSVLVEIKDSGSTNAAGWDLRVYTDGSGKLNGSKDFTAHTFDTADLKQSLDTTDLSSFVDDCARSASFGSVETLIYHTKTTQGIDCYIDNNQQSLLSIQLDKALQAAGLH